MADFNVGDVVTFRLRGDRFGIATVVLVEDLALHTNYHLVIHDAVIEGSDGDVDELGEPFERVHDEASIDTSSIAVDHLGVTQHGLDESELMVVGEREPADEELIGYRIWLAAARRAAAERGLYGLTRRTSVSSTDEARRDDEEEALPEDHDVEEVDTDTDAREESADVTEEVEGGGDETQVESDGTEDSVEDGGDDLTDEEVLASTELRPWHLRLFDRPIGAAIFEMHEALTAPPYGATTLGSYVASFYDGSKTDEIRELIDRLVDGDYGAGQELLDYGDPAAVLLRERLPELREPEQVADALQILADMGTDSAYAALAEYFVAHDDVGRDDLAIPAVRAFAYAVMLTGGSPEPLASEAERLAAIDHPELNDDISSAMKAIRDLKPAEVADTTPKETSSNPFGTLGV